MEEINDQMFQEKIQTSAPMAGSSVSTLLIPEDLLKRFNRRLKRKGGKKKYFTYLVGLYRTILRSFCNEASGLRTEYQWKNQKLQKVNFRPENEDWAELGAFSAASGKSRCLLFVYLLLMDLNGWGAILKLAGISPKYPKSDKYEWELLGAFGLNRSRNECRRELHPRVIHIESG